jgi:hypothetical protein
MSVASAIGPMLNALFTSTSSASLLGRTGDDPSPIAGTVMSAFTASRRAARASSSITGSMLAPLRAASTRRARRRPAPARPPAPTQADT